MVQGTGAAIVLAAVMAVTGGPSRARDEGGDYYLPYQIIATKDQFLKAYPRAPDYFALKQRLDPAYRFRNRLWDTYNRPAAP